MLLYVGNVKKDGYQTKPQSRIDHENGTDDDEGRSARFGLKYIGKQAQEKHIPY